MADKKELAKERVFLARMIGDFNLYTAQEVHELNLGKEEFITTDGTFSLRYVAPYERKGRRDSHSDGLDKPRVKVSAFFRKMLSLKDHHELYPIEVELKKVEHKIHKRDSEWHHLWKERVKEFCELEKRFYKDGKPSKSGYKIADAYYPETNTVIEFQKAFSDEALSKSEFYKKENMRLIWLFYLPTLSVFEDDNFYKIREDNFYHFFRIENSEPNFFANNIVFIQDKNDRIFYVEQMNRVESNNELEATVRCFKKGLEFNNPNEFTNWFRFEWGNSSYYKNYFCENELKSIDEILDFLKEKPDKCFYLQNGIKNDVNGFPLIYCFFKDNGIIRRNSQGVLSYRCYIDKNNRYSINNGWDSTVHNARDKKWILLATNLHKYRDRKIIK